ncbi:hypothetical protein LINGRAHAP2_LOCUS23032, partial [Linum grandiflorum]
VSPTNRRRALTTRSLGQTHTRKTASLRDLKYSEASRAIRFQFRAKMWIIEARRS